MISDEFMCLTCGYSQTIVIDDDGTSEETANRAHTVFDGAHRANWLTEVDGKVYSPEELRTALIEAERKAYAAMEAHYSFSTCSQCAHAYSSANTDAQFMEKACKEGRDLRTAWLTAFAANGHRSGPGRYVRRQF